MTYTLNRCIILEEFNRWTVGENMNFFRLISGNELLSFIILNIALIDSIQAISVFRKGFGQIVSLAGYYGDRVLIILILIVSSILTKNRVEFQSDPVVQAIVVLVIYVVSVTIAQKYLPPPTIEDTYHNFVVLPAFAIILICGGFKALGCANRAQYIMMAVCLLTWLTLLIVDVKGGRLDQKTFMTERRLPV